MSRAYDGRLAALKAYPDDEEAAIDLFMEFIELSETDFIYEFSMTPRDYLFGDKE